MLSNHHINIRGFHAASSICYNPSYFLHLPVFFFSFSKCCWTFKVLLIFNFWLCSSYFLLISSYLHLIWLTEENEGGLNSRLLIMFLLVNGSHVFLSQEWKQTNITKKVGLTSMTGIQFIKKGAFTVQHEAYMSKEQNLSTCKLVSWRINLYIEGLPWIFHMK